MKRPPRNADEVIRRLYVDQGATIQQIAARLSMGRNWVRVELDRLKLRPIEARYREPGRRPVPCGPCGRMVRGAPPKPSDAACQECGRVLGRSPAPVAFPRDIYESMAEALS